MTDRNDEQINDFLWKLEKGLARPGRQSADIVEEVRANLEAHIKRLRDEGHSENEAVAAALAEMGDPYEFAQSVRREIPPFGGPVVTTIRYVAASGVLVWMLLLMWLFRAWSYGLSGSAANLGVLFLHVPIILLLWPRIVWRKNWLFGLIPAGLAFMVALVLNIGGVESSEQITIPLTEAEVAEFQRQAALRETTAADKVPVAALIMLAAVTMATLVLLLAMQQRAPRRLVVLLILLLAALVEVPYQVEEHLFRQDRERIRTYLATALKETGAYPSDEELKADGPRIRGGHPRVNISSEGFSLSWSRPLSPGFAIRYSSGDDRVRIQD